MTNQYFRIFHILRETFLTVSEAEKLNFDLCRIQRNTGWSDKKGKPIFEDDVVLKNRRELYVVKFDSFSHHFYLSSVIRFSKECRDYDEKKVWQIRREAVDRDGASYSYLTESSAVKLNTIVTAHIFSQHYLDKARALR